MTDFDSFVEQHSLIANLYDFANPESNDIFEECLRTLRQMKLTYVRLGALWAINVRNFKTFESEHFIGPFTAFTGIVGPNGGGKTNISDAVKFVLGCSIEILRCNGFEDLIFRHYSDLDASVELIFTDYNDRHGRISLKRTISSRGLTKVYLQNREVPEHVMTHFLTQSRVLPKSFHMQTQDQDTLMQMNPQELAHLVEEFSGSIGFKPECDRLETQIKKLTKSSQKSCSQRAQLETKKNDLLLYKMADENYRLLMDAVQDLRKKVKLRTIQSIFDEKQKLNQKQVVEDDQAQIENQNELNKHELQIESLLEEKKQLETSVANTDVAQPDPLNREIQIDGANKVLGALQMQLVKQKDQLKAMNQQLNDYDEDINDKGKAIEKLQSKCKPGYDFQNEYNQLKNDHDNRLDRAEINTIKEKQRMFVGMIDDITREMEDCQTRLNSNQEQLREFNKTRQNADIEDEKLQIQLEKTVETLQKIKSTRIKDEEKLKKLIEKRSELEQMITILEVNNDERQQKDDRTLLLELSVSFKDFKGQLAELCRPTVEEYNMPLKIVLASRLNCLIVEKVETANAINIRLKQRNQVKGLMILDNVPKSNVNQLKKQIDEFCFTFRDREKFGKAILAINAIKFEPYLEDLMNKLLEGIVICDNDEIAFALTKQRIQGVKKIVTLNGTEFKNASIRSHSQQKTILLPNFVIKNKQQVENTSNLKQSYEQLEKLNGQIRQANTLNIEQEEKEQSALKVNIEQKRVELLKLKSRCSQRIADLEQDVKLYHEKIQELQAELADKQRHLDAMKSSVDEMASFITSKVCKEFCEFYRLKDKDLNQLEQIFQSQLLIGQKKTQINNLMKNKELVQQQVDKQESIIEDLQDRIEAKKVEIHNLSVITAPRGRKSSPIDVSRVQQAKDKLTEIDDKIRQIRKEIQRLLRGRDKLQRKSIAEKQKYASCFQRIEELDEQLSDILLQAELENIDLKDKDGDFDYGVLDNQGLDQLMAKLEFKESELNEEIMKEQEIGHFDQKAKQEFSNIIKQLTFIHSEIIKYDKEIVLAKKQLNDVEKKRKDKFMSYFHHLEDSVKESYRILTQNNFFGGHVSIFVRNPDDPYRSGVVFQAIPPNKPHKVKGTLLSGAEKAISSISLHLALNSCIGSPLLIYDELDANLDHENQERYREALQVMSSQMQLLVISHKLEVFQYAESLVGVTVQKGKITSEAFSILLKTL